MFLRHDLDGSKKISTQASEKASKGSGIFRNRRPAGLFCLEQSCHNVCFWPFELYEALKFTVSE